LCDRQSPFARVAFTACTLSVIVGSAAACRPSERETMSRVVESPTALERTARLASALDERATGDSGDVAPVARWVLPPALQEISGTALTRDGRLLVHVDEVGQVWEIDYRRGALIKRFSLGRGAVDADFEGITIVRDTVWMLTSKGVLYAFAEGANGEHVAFTKYDTGLRKQCEFEGVAYDATLRALLLACKHVNEKALRGHVVIYRWRVPGERGAALAPLTLSVESLRGSQRWTKLEPTDITVDPRTGNYVLIASQQQALVAFTPTGAPVFARPLPSEHEQSEGLAITMDGLLLIADEAAKGPALLTLYRWP
jgi:uncharacterized protein YjiK